MIKRGDKEIERRRDREIERLIERKERERDII